MPPCMQHGTKESAHVWNKRQPDFRKPILCTECAGIQTAGKAPGTSLFAATPRLSPSATLLQPSVRQCKRQQITRLPASTIGRTSTESATTCVQNTVADLREAMYLSSRASQIAYNRSGEFNCLNSISSIMLPFGEEQLSLDDRQRTLSMFKAEPDSSKQHQYAMHQSSNLHGSCCSIIAACGGTRQAKDWGCNLHLTPDHFANPASFKVCMFP